MEDIVVGVASQDIDLQVHPSEGMPYWGYICCAGKKVTPGEEMSPYGEACTISDTVGVLLEFVKAEAKVTFYRNQVSLLLHHSLRSP